ncbi:MAG TPA: hypothetical protein DC009_01035 [Porphyromonadaceae bacterium]|nr:hypothetical protein [Porphyromonadaceae bacterium]
MKVIQDNPYRLFGVYANSPAKERVANMRRLTAFMKVGKQVSFPLDLPMLGGATRTDETIAEANSRLTLPKDQFHYAQFWFVKLTPLDEIAFNHLTSGDTAKAIEIWGKKATASSYQNIIVCSLAQGNYSTAIKFAEALYANAGYVAELAEAATGNRDIVTAKAASLDFIDTLCDELRLETILPHITNSEWKRHLTDRSVKPLIASIEAAISVAEKSGKEPIARYNAGIKLYNDTKAPLQKLAQLISKSDLQYQLIADKVGLAIRSCAIDFYNNSTTPYPAKSALILQQYAEATVVSQATVEKCRKEREFFQKKVEEMPPDSVVYYDQLLKKLINDFMEQPSTITNAAKFILSCIPYLMSIKSELGWDNNYFIRICTRVAENALGDIILDYNNQTEKLRKQPIGDSSGTLTKIRALVKSAVIAMYHLNCLNLDKEFRQNRFKNNYAIIVKQARELNVFADGIALALGIIKSDLEFDAALKKNGFDTRDEKGYFDSISSLSDCYNYQYMFPNGNYAASLTRKIEIYEYNECSTIEDLRKFKARYPNTQYDLSKKEDEIVFNSCKTIDQYRQYISNYSIHRKEALNRIDDLTFDNSRTHDDYIQYLNKFPKGRHRLDAQRQLEYIDFRNCKSISDFENFLRTYPKSRYVKEAKSRAEEEKLWAKCQKRHSWKLCKKYIREYPNGQHYRDAKEKSSSPLERLSKWAGRHKVVTTLLSLVAVVLIIAGISNGMYGIGVVLSVIGGIIGFFSVFIIFEAFELSACGICIAFIFLAIGIPLSTCGEKERDRQKILDDYSNYSKLVTGNHSFREYESFISSYASAIDESQLDTILNRYYPTALDSCNQSIERFSDDYSYPSGLGYLKIFEENCHDEDFAEKARTGYAQIVDSLYSVAKTRNTSEAWEHFQNAVSHDDYRDSEERKRKALNKEIIDYTKESKHRRKSKYKRTY